MSAGPPDFERDVTFVWFWTFWHWGTESFRAGSLLRDPIHGVGGHWDEWFHHEASIEERQAIDDAGRTPRRQRQFIGWLARRWAPEAGWRGDHPPVRFVLGQLAQLAPFDHWPTFARYREGCGIGGVSAVVLAEDSSGESADVRRVTALAVPASVEPGARRVVAEGFDVDPSELNAAACAAMSLLSGSGLLVLLALWIAGGRRPYPRSVGFLLSAGWLLAGLLIVRLAVGPEPGDRLVVLSATVVGLWGTLLVTGLAVAGTVSVQAWRLGRHWRRRLERSQLRLRMNGAMTVIGGSAGLPFCLGMLLSVYRAPPRTRLRSWIWQQFFRRLRSDAASWAATGIVAADGRIEPVVLRPKVRACLQHAGISRLLTPHQRDAKPGIMSHVADDLPPRALAGRSRAAAITPGPLLGFATGPTRLRSHRCRHLAQAVIAVGDLASARQMAVTALAVAVSLTMVVALPDLRGILHPPPAPTVVRRSPFSAYSLGVSLDTRHPENFWVALESTFWANRRAPVLRYGGDGIAARSEMRLHAVARNPARDVDDGTVWVERRHRFLGREFTPGERVGRYSLSYLVRLHE